MLKIILNKQKGVYIRAEPRGYDVALRATWECHVDPRKCLRGAYDVNIIYIILRVIVHIRIP